MATVVPPEHVEAPAQAAAQPPPGVEVRKVAIDGNTLSVLAIGVALFALAFGAFTHLSGRIDGLETKLSGRIDGLDTKLGGRIDGLDTKLGGRMDSLDAKIEKLSAEQRAENREINARLDRLFELIAGQGRERAR